MIDRLLTSFQTAVAILPFLGLMLDAVGAILVLGPEVPGVASFMTRWERDDLRQTREQLKEGNVITPDHPNFDDLLITIRQGEVEGPTLRPFSRTADEDGFLRAIDEVEGTEDEIQLKHTGDTFGTVSYSELDRWIESYRGQDWLYYVGGAFLLVMGFFLQAVAELAKFSLPIAFVVCVIGFVAIPGYMIRVY